MINFAKGLTKLVILTSLCLGWYSAQGATVADLTSGHWVEVRGHYSSGSTSTREFAASKITLSQPSDEVTLIGTITRSRTGQLALLGLPLVLDREVRLRELVQTKLIGARVKAEGELSARGVFIASTLSARGAGRDRLTAMIQSIEKKSEVTTLQLAGLAVTSTAQTALDLADGGSFANYVSVDLRTTKLGLDTLDDDDRFGDGLALTDSLRLIGRLQGESSWEDNFNFDDTDNENRTDLEVGVRARLEWQPTTPWFGVLELRYDARHRERRDRRNTDESDLSVGEFYVTRYLSERGQLTMGRQDFDDPREWLFDENLDAVRLRSTIGPITLDGSVSKIFSNDGSRDEEAINTMLYVSNNDRERSLAAYLVHRKFASIHDESSYHLGVRALGEWLPQASVWFELSNQRGRRERADIDAWALDIGGTWAFGAQERWYATTGLAYATGDDPATGNDERFRQTGLQDNNGKLGGVTSFRYYGELSDPELSNLVISTIGIGRRFTQDLSLDLISHHYRLHRHTTEELEAEWDSDFSGDSRSIGFETDLVVGYRGMRRWEVEGVFGYFKPGQALENQDLGWFGKLQLKLRY